MWNASRFCVSSLRSAAADLRCKLEQLKQLEHLKRIETKLKQIETKLKQLRMAAALLPSWVAAFHVFCFLFLQMDTLTGVGSPYFRHPVFRHFNSSSVRLVFVENQGLFAA